MVNFIPERTIASVEYAPDQDDPVGIDTVTLSATALTVPQFIIANGADQTVGTARPYAYFEQYRKLGAPLTFLIQNRTPHCCVANIVPALGWFGTLQLRESGVKEEGAWLPSLEFAQVWLAFARTENHPFTPRR
jgi:hypothetical protein